MQKVFLSIFIILFSLQASAQDNVADIAHAFIKAVKSNDISLIQKHFVKSNNAHKILPKEAIGMTGKEQNRKYIIPLHNRFKENFDKIQAQIKNQNINVRNIDLQSYKMEKQKSVDEPAQATKQFFAMSLFFNYDSNEHVVPISVVEIDEEWFILEILYVTDLFKKK